ncbi:hypothetical protein A2397_05015 [Candidatus Amesbacteria bacterium RIFOXYB1_FULL_44_23]|uniref:Glycosyltransferase RgtA/B/C/D-like domain-containing protein n=1 Tax=Candidatus Amesbacteria bacterium RIFOXYB1_FULL_44_23 TaxID=1797263 RepID=A0A1F4ZS33_9BACT|nr:MAG: hypothetical protein A2397_05015 [Candidatus Amesbacteria bacterium RIFOXYB1_FULL_44_23]
MIINSFSLISLLGFQLITWLLFVLSYFLKINLLNFPTWTFWLVIAAWITFVARHNLRQLFILLFAILIFILPSLWFPVTGWDSITLYDFRAQILLHTGNISDTLFRASVVDYPMFTTLLHFLFYRSGLSTPMPIYAFLYLLFGLQLYSLFRRTNSAKLSLVLALVVTMAPKLFEHSHIAYANFPYTIYLVLGTFYLYYWTINKKMKDLLLGILLCLASLWIRSFPFGLIPILAAMFVSIKSTRTQMAAIIVAAIAILIKYWPINFSILVGILDFIKWGILKYYFPYPLIFVLSVIYQFQSKTKNWFIPFTILGFWAAIIIGNYSYALTDRIFAQIPDALQRTVMFLNPSISLYFLLLLTSKSKT